MLLGISAFQQIKKIYFASSSLLKNIYELSSVKNMYIASATKFMGARSQALKEGGGFEH